MEISNQEWIQRGDLDRISDSNVDELTGWQVSTLECEELRWARLHVHDGGTEGDGIGRRFHERVKGREDGCRAGNGVAQLRIARIGCGL